MATFSWTELHCAKLAEPLQGDILLSTTKSLKCLVLI